MTHFLPGNIDPRWFTDLGWRAYDQFLLGNGTEKVAREPPSRGIEFAALFTGTPVHVVDHVYLGSSFTAANRAGLADAGITHVVNATRHASNYFEDDGVKYCRVSLEDQESESMERDWDRVAGFIERTRVDGGRVLVHCNWGRSRSVVLILDYLMREYGLTVPDAIKLVVARRPAAAVNVRFLQDLRSRHLDLRSRKLRFDDPAELKQLVQQGIDPVFYEEHAVI